MHTDLYLVRHCGCGGRRQRGKTLLHLVQIPHKDYVQGRPMLAPTSVERSLVAHLELC